MPLFLEWTPLNPVLVDGSSNEFLDNMGTGALKTGACWILIFKNSQDYIVYKN